MAHIKLYSKQVSFVPGSVAELALEIDTSKSNIDFENFKFFLKQEYMTKGIIRCLLFIS